MIRNGRDPKDYVRIPDGWGYGEKVYPGRLTHLHRLHCLHALRKLVYPDRYNVTFPLSKPDVLHGNHCVGVLYEHLACTPTWEFTPGAFFIFSNCLNYSRVFLSFS